MKDGFHIHHIDGNHQNNDPKNLLLIEGADHLKLHGLDVYAQARNSNRQPKHRRREKVVYIIREDEHLLEGEAPDLPWEYRYRRALRRLKKSDFSQESG